MLGADITIPCNNENDLPKPPFCMALFAPSRGGKSTLIQHLFTKKHLLKKTFRDQDMFIFCPSLEFNDDFKDFETPNKFGDFDTSLMGEIVNEQKLVIDTYGKKRAPHILMIFDDCFDDPRFQNNPLLKMLAFRGRHMKLSIIVSGQKASSCPRGVRLNLTHLCWFQPSNMSELDFIAEEFTEKKRRQEVIGKFKEVWRDSPYQFMFFDLLNKDPTRKIRIGFSGDFNHNVLE